MDLKQKLCKHKEYEILSCEKIKRIILVNVLNVVINLIYLNPKMKCMLYIL